MTSFLLSEKAIVEFPLVAVSVAVAEVEDFVVVPMATMVLIEEKFPVEETMPKDDEVSFRDGDLVREDVPVSEEVLFEEALNIVLMSESDSYILLKAFVGLANGCTLLVAVNREEDRVVSSSRSDDNEATYVGLLLVTAEDT